MSSANAAGHAAQPRLHHHFESYEQQRESATLGMWFFIAQEILFFGGIFMAYIVYRMANPVAFAAASHELDITLGGFNTVVLIASSLTMAMGVRAAQLGDRKKLVTFLLLTILLGMTFLGVDAVQGVVRRAVDRGEIVEINTPDAFFSNPQHERTKLFLSQILH